MDKEARPGMMTHPEPQEAMEHAYTIPNASRVVNSRLKDYREAVGASPADIVAILTARFAKYDTALQSKCENTDQYGIEPCKAAFDLLDIHFKRTKRATRHRRQKRVMCRLSDEDYAAFKSAIEASSYPTMQAYMERSIKRFIKRRTMRDVDPSLVLEAL